MTDAIVKAMDFKGEYSFDTSRADGQFRKPASNKKLLSLIGGFQFTPFDQGIFTFFMLCPSRKLTMLISALDETVKWFAANYNTARTGKVGA